MRQTDGQTDFTTASAVLHYVAWPKIVKMKCEKHLYAQMTTKQNIKKFEIPTEEHRRNRKLCDRVCSCPLTAWCTVSTKFCDIRLTHCGVNTNKNLFPYSPDTAVIAVTDHGANKTTKSSAVADRLHEAPCYLEILLEIKSHKIAQF